MPNEEFTPGFDRGGGKSSLSEEDSANGPAAVRGGTAAGIDKLGPTENFPGITGPSLSRARGAYPDAVGGDEGDRYVAGFAARDPNSGVGTLPGLASVRISSESDEVPGGKVEAGFGVLALDAGTSGETEMEAVGLTDDGAFLGPGEVDPPENEGFTADVDGTTPTSSPPCERRLFSFPCVVIPSGDFASFSLLIASLS
jgi:hypothetical protein